MDRLYCTLAEVLNDLQRNGLKDESKLVDFIRAASHVIDKRGQFIPVTEQRSFDGNGDTDLWVSPLLALTACALVESTQTTLTLTSADYMLYPRNRWWENGPYTRLAVDRDSTQIGAWTRGQGNVQPTGRWGLYEETRSTGALGTNATDTTTDLTVDNAANISPGAVLLIESEQELVEATGSPTDSTANINEAVDTSEEEIDLTDATKINVSEIARIDFEQMRCLDKAGSTALFQRGWNGTSKVAHSINADVYVYRTFTVKRGVNGTPPAAHAAQAIRRYWPPRDVNYLCRQIAGLMLKKSESGWAGKVGNAELGETFYFNEFPNDPLKKIMEPYAGMVTG